MRTIPKHNPAPNLHMNIYVPIIYNIFVYVRIVQFLPQAVCRGRTKT